MPLDTIWAGIRAGLADARADLDIRCRMILDVDKAPAAGRGRAGRVRRQRRPDELIGIGGDTTERGIDHHTFATAFTLAGRRRVRRTMHCGEDGPAETSVSPIDALGCERIDHGVRLLDDPTSPTG